MYKFLLRRFFILIIFTLISACSVSKKNKKVDCVKFDVFEICSPDIKHFKNNDLDSLKEIITFSNLTIESDISNNGFSGPETLEEYILKIFRSYHYLSFFDKIHIDKKVQKLFRDSVSIDKISKMPENFEKECKNCNYLLLLKFKKTIYPYEIYLAESLTETLNSNSVEIIQQEGINFKFYETSEIRGAYISQIKSKRKDKKLSLKLTDGNFNEFKSFIQKTIKINTESGD